MAAPAQADDDDTLTVAGTSDVSDSGLVDNVLKPGFLAAYKAQTGKDLTFKYLGSASDQAIANAKQGLASALIVHAASLENTFAQSGFSAEPYGRAIFWGDYVLLGPKTDPAQILDSSGNPSHDIVTAFEKIARTGAAHNAKLFSRAKAPGTTVQEHALWGLARHEDPALDATTLCAVAADAGGGYSPSSDASCPSTPAYPSWYVKPALSQGKNVAAADACTTPTADDSRTDDCYVFTDRGTYENLRSQGALSQLVVVGNDNEAAARGGSTALVNSFHAYAVNPNADFGAPGVQINSTAAKAFLDYLTSPAAQLAVSKYLADSAGGAPFLPSAAPALTQGNLPNYVGAGKALTIGGTLRNVVPGTPALANQKVTLESQPVLPAGSPYTAVASTQTNSTGYYVLSYKPTEYRRYRIVTSELTQVENSTLSPPFADMLAPASGPVHLVQVINSVSGVTASSPSSGHLRVSGSLAPRSFPGGWLLVEVLKTGSGQAYRSLGTKHLTTNSASFSYLFSLAKGSYRYRVTYANPGYAASVTTPSSTITVR